jgi:hypothetical protein
VEAGAEDEFAIDQLLFGEVLDRAASDGDIFGGLLAG